MGNNIKRVTKIRNKSLGSKTLVKTQHDLMTKCLFFSGCPNIDGHCYWVSIPVSIIKWPFNQITKNQIDFKENHLASAERCLVCLLGSVNQPVIFK